MKTGDGIMPHIRMMNDYVIMQIWCIAPYSLISVVSDRFRIYFSLATKSEAYILNYMSQTLIVFPRRFAIFQEDVDISKNLR